MAQSKGTAKLYAYRQPVAPGVGKGTIDISGEELPSKQRGGQNLLLYIAAPSQIYPSAVWIDGESYGVRAKSVAKSPVTHTTSEGTSRTLVPRTGNRIWQLTPAPAASGKVSRKVEALARSSAVVVEYKYKGKFYYTSLKELTELDAAAMQ
jgi:hypothetical protein